MSSATRRPAWAPKPAAAFSPAADKLIAQLQAEARAQLLADLSSKDAITVLHGVDPETRRVVARADEIEVEDDKGNRRRLHRQREEPASWKADPYMAGIWHPSHWTGRQTFVDANGVEWTSYLDTLVCDDFGNLVEVPER